VAQHPLDPRSRSPAADCQPLASLSQPDLWSYLSGAANIFAVSIIAALQGHDRHSGAGQAADLYEGTDKRILKLLDNRPRKGLHAESALCWPRRWAMLASNISGGSCGAARFTSRPASPGARATTRTIQSKPPMLLASTSPRPRRPLCHALTRSPRSRPWSERRLSQVAQ
jgi:hypothetical protein